jgi:glycosyltransferase involved in cell wall biosynthesis
VKNLGRCLAALDWADEVYVIDSGSTDGTIELAERSGAKVVQFEYRGGWPKKRQWAMDTLPLRNDWILLLDADEVVTPALAQEIRAAIGQPEITGYQISLQMHFLGRALRYGDTKLYKLSLFRRGKGRFERRLEQQDSSMADMEIHEHVLVDGASAKLRESLIHHNYNSLSRYIQKHDEYSNWEAHVLSAEKPHGELKPSLFGSQAQRRRWLKLAAFRLPGSSFILFAYRYVLRGGFLDGRPGLIYCALQGVQMFHTKAKIYELRHQPDEPPVPDSGEAGLPN